MSFYEEMAAVASEVLGEFKQGAVQLIRTVPGALDPDQPWVPVIDGTATYALEATVRRVQQKYVDGTLIVATDDQLVFAVPAVTPLMTDTFTVDGQARVLKDLRPLPAAGSPVAYIAFLAS